MADWLNTPLLVIAVLAVAGTLWGIVLFIWKVALRTAKLDAGERDFRTFAQEIRGKIEKIEGHVVQIFLRLPPTPAGVKSGSPFQLTDFGKEMARNMGAQDWAAEVAPNHQAELAGKRAFEIDEFSRKYVHEKMRRDERVSKCMYRMGVERDNALSVLQVVLRDQLIAVLGYLAGRRLAGLARWADRPTSIPGQSITPLGRRERAPVTARNPAAARSGPRERRAPSRG